jgi:ribosomal RNA small subunit methyltransferase A
MQMQQDWSTLSAIAADTGLRPKEIGNILTLLLDRESIDNRDIPRITCLPKSAIRDLLRVIQPLLEPVSQTVSLSPEGRRRVKEILEQTSTKRLVRDFSSEDEGRIRRVFEKYPVFRPDPDRNLDQFRATVETQVARAKLLLTEGHIQGQNVLFVGDNDLTSVAVACLETCNSVTVIDIDVRVLETVELIACTEGLAIETVWQDLRDNLQARLRNSFDLCFTDPPYTETGVKLFVSRAVQALRGEPGALLYLCYGYSRRGAERAVGIQQVLNESGLVIYTKLPDFNRYHGAESIGSCSSLYVCTTTKMTRPLITSRCDEPLYTGQTSRATFQPDADRLDQHFLVSEEVIATLIEAAQLESNETVLEIGPGLGTLTTRLASRASEVIAVELDRRLRENLEKLAQQLGNVRLVWGNVLELELPKFDKLVANLPYSIIEPLIEKLKASEFKRAALMTGARFARAAKAWPGDEEFGKLSLLTQCYFQIEVVQTINRTAFRPKPRVKSAIIVMVPLDKAQLLSIPELFVMREVFEQRDRLVKNALREGLIRYTQALDKSMTKNEARAIIADVISDETALSVHFENLNNQQIENLYRGVKLWASKRTLEHEKSD